MKKLQLQWTWQQIGFYGISLVSGFAIFSAITVITGAVSFWTIKSEEIVSLLTDNNYRLKNYCDYPIQIYGKGVQFLLTFVIPYAFTGYYPIAKLLEKEVPWPDICYLGPVVALLFGGIAYVLWCTGIKRYNGAGV